MLELVKLKKRLQGFTLDLDCRIESGVTVLFGPSGAGKTLTLDCIAGFASPDEGRILLHDVILFDHGAKVNLPPQKRRCGYVFQNYALFPQMTLRENLAFATIDDEAVQEMLDQFRLTQAAHKYPHELSGGQKQRGSIARALLAAPKILLLDEPARGLDAELRQELYSVLRQVRKEFSTPILLVTHDLDECFELGDRMLVIRGGRVVQSGTPAEVLATPASPEVAKLFGCFNVFSAEIINLNEAENTSRLRVGEDNFLEAAFIPGHARGDTIWLAVRTNALRAWPRTKEPLGVNQVAAILERAVRTPAGIRFEFAGDLNVDQPLDGAIPTGRPEWVVEFPPEALLVLQANR
jgi:molybdate transport system ATP-binding protein